MADQKQYTTAASSGGDPVIHDIFENYTSTWQYIVADPATLTAAIIDPVLDYDPVTQKITTASADALLALVKEKNYKVDWILETHAHADHLTSSSYLKKKIAEMQGYSPSVGIGGRIGQVQERFAPRYSIPPNELKGVFDKLFADDEQFNIGELKATAIHLPGHTPDHLGYKVSDNIFCGDSIFHVDIGSARCDFPGGDANQLYQSARKLLNLPDHVKLWVGHDYPSGSRVAPVASVSVADHRAQNLHLRDGVGQDEFVAMRQKRDASLASPRLIHQSLQVNTRAGRLPEPTESGDRMLHVPLKLQSPGW